MLRPIKTNNLEAQFSQMFDFGLSTQFYRLDLANKQRKLNRRPVPTNATKNYQVGDRVTECTPIAKALFGKYKGKLCDYCLKETNLKRCGGCGCFYYCSKKCQIADWNDAHKFKECSLYKANPTTANELDEHCRLLARIYLMIRASKSKELNQKSQANGSSEDKNFDLLYKDHTCFNGAKRNLIEMLSHFDKMKLSATMEVLRMYKSSYKELMGLKYDWFSDDLLVILGIILSNAFEIGETFDKPLAAGLFVQTSIFDHSCDCNTRTTFDGDKMILVASKPINPGDLITIMYRDPEPKDEFYTVMRTNYYCRCQCRLCEQIPPLDKSKFEFNVLRRTFHGHSYRGYTLLSLLTLRDMIKMSKRWPDEQHFDVDLEIALSLISRANMADYIDDEALELPDMDEAHSMLSANRELSPEIRHEGDWLKKYLDECRHHKLANKKYKAGDIIRDSMPNFYTVLPELKGKYCDLCLTQLDEVEEIYTCDTCHKFSYCSKACFYSDKVLHQAFECLVNSRDMSNFLRKNENSKIAYYIRFYMSIKLMRQNFRIRDERLYKTISDGVDGLTIDKLAKLRLKRNSKDVIGAISYKVFCEDTCPRPEKFGNPLYDMLDFLEETWPEYNLNYDRLVDTYGFAQSNLFYVQDEKSNKTIAIGSFATFRLTPHSSKPNSEFILQDGKLSLRAKEDIPSGKGITVGYH